MNPSATATSPRKKTGSFSQDIIPKGYQKKPAQLQNFTDEQLEHFKSLFGMVDPESFLAKLAGGDEETFNQMEAPAMRQFQELLGGISSKFSAGSGRGSMGGRRSSGFQNTTTSAASNFAQDLQSRRQDLQRQAVQDLMGISEQLLNKKPFERSLVKKEEKSPSKWGGLIGAGLGAAGGFFAGGPTGAASGAKMGYDVGSLF